MGGRLTMRASRAPTACRAGHQALGLRPILRLLSSASRRRLQLTSNVRLHKLPVLWFTSKKTSMNIDSENNHQPQESLPERPESIPFDSPEAEGLNANYTVSSRMRGIFIDQAIGIDLLITDIISQYFVAEKSKRSLFFSDVVSGPDSSFRDRKSVV